MCGILYSPVVASLVGQQLHASRAVFIAEFQLMLAMYMNSVSIVVRIAGPRVADHACASCRARRAALPRERLVDAPRLAVRVDQQILGPVHEAERRRRRARRSALRVLPGRFGRRHRLRDTAAGSGSRRAHRSRRAASAADAARGRCGSRWSAREMPRIACIDTGRPIIFVVLAARRSRSRRSAA